FRVAIEAGELARRRHAQVVRACARMRIVTGGALHAAASEPVRVRLIAERRHLRRMADRAEFFLLPAEEIGRARFLVLDLMTSQAVDHLGSGVYAGRLVHAHAERDMNRLRLARVLVMALEARAVGSFASVRNVDERCFAAALVMRAAVAMAGFAEGIG